MEPDKAGLRPFDGPALLTVHRLDASGKMTIRRVKFIFRERLSGNRVLAGAKLPVPCISKAWYNISVFIEMVVNRAHVNWNIGMGFGEAL